MWIASTRPWDATSRAAASVASSAATAVHPGQLRLGQCGTRHGGPHRIGVDGACQAERRREGDEREDVPMLSGWRAWAAPPDPAEVVPPRHADRVALAGR